MTTTTHKTLTLIDLAQAMNRLIDERPNDRNPQSSDDSTTCLYHDADTDQRCLIGQALYDLTGHNVPVQFEGLGIGVILANGEFRRFFGLHLGDESMIGVENAIVKAQAEADGVCAWGTIDKIEV